MTEHKWMIDVLEDLETYAASNDLSSLQCLIGEARSRAENDFMVFATTKERMRSFPNAERLN